VLEIKESNIVVVKRRKDRVLLSDNIVYSRLKDGTIYTRSYWDYFSVLPALYSNPKILMIGLGGGTIPYQINHLFGSRAKIDVVEIDPNMVTASKAFLPGKIDANIIIEDGIAYVAKCKGEYDIIILDSFKKDNIPDPFFEEKFIENVYNALTDDGVFAINYTFSTIGVLRQHSYKAIMEKRFNVYAINLQPMLANQIFIASKRFSKEEMLELLEKGFPKDAENAFILNGYKRMG